MEGTIGEIRLFAGNFAPGNWSYCNGSLLSIAEYTPLFALIGTTYGGDGQTTFALPDMRSRVAVGTGQGLGMSTNYELGQVGGIEDVTLLTSQMPAHNHFMSENLTATAAIPATNGDAATNEPSGTGYAITSNGLQMYNSAATPGVSMGGSTGSYTATMTMLPSGGSAPHNNIQPYQALNFIICLEGIYPSRN